MTARVAPSNGATTAEEIWGMAARVWVRALGVGLWNLLLELLGGKKVLFLWKQTGGEKEGDKAMLRSAKKRMRGGGGGTDNVI